MLLTARAKCVEGTKKRLTSYFIEIEFAIFGGHGHDIGQRECLSLVTSYRGTARIKRSVQ